MVIHRVELPLNPPTQQFLCLIFNAVILIAFVPVAQVGLAAALLAQWYKWVYCFVNLFIEKLYSCCISGLRACIVYSQRVAARELQLCRWVSRYPVELFSVVQVGVAGVPGTVALPTCTAVVVASCYYYLAK